MVIVYLVIGDCIPGRNIATIMHCQVHNRAGPQSQKWSDQQNTSDPTGSIHKKAREKKFDPKKVYFDEGVFI